MKKLIIATGNPGKVREIEALLNGEYDSIMTMKEAGIKADIVEDADTFLGNAAIKALTVSRLTDADVLADDSGLCVDGLDGRPGVYSARYSMSGTDEDNNRKLVEECSCIPEEDRTAHYVCALVLARNGEEVFSCEGTCDGRIILEARGKNGFGYDPYFFLDDYGITFGEMDPDIKNRISHRANALAAFKRFVEEN